MSISLTPKAAARMHSILLEYVTDETATKGIRVFVQDDGSGGYEYAMNITSKPKPDDLVIEQNNVTVYVDAKSAPHLRGMEIDFVEGVAESGFKFIDPNASDCGGCGKSSTGNCSPKTSCGQ